MTRAGSRSVTYILALLIVAGLALRIHTATGRYEKGDSIIVALMANDIASGAQYPLWYYGGPYAGALESWLTAPLIWAIGPSWAVIPFVPIVVSTAGIVAFYLLGSAIGGARAGLFAGALWAFAPWGASFYNVSPRGCYPETVCGGAMILWYATLRWKGERMSIATSFAIGLLAGVLIWTRLLVVPYVITLAIVLLLVDRAKFFNIRNMTGLGGIVIGALPFLFAWKKVLDQDSVGRMEISGMTERFHAMYATLLGGYEPDGAPYLWITTASRASFAFALGSVFIFIVMPVFLVARRFPRLPKNPQHVIAREPLATVAISNSLIITLRDCFASLAMTLRRVFQQPANKLGINTVPLTLFTLIFSAIYLSNTASLTSQVRYSLPFYTALILCPALAADWLACRSRALGVAVIIFLAGSATVVTQINFALIKKGEASIRDSVRASVSQLQSLGVRSVIINDYNLMLRFSYEALTRGYALNAMDVGGNLNMRWTMAVERDQDPVHLHLMAPGEGGQFAQWLKSCCGGEYASRDIAGSAGIHHIKVVAWPSASIPPLQWDISPNGKALADRIHGTTMFSNARQEVVVTLDRPRDLTKVRIIYGDRWPESVTLDRSVDGVSWERISGPQPPSRLYPVGDRVYERLAWEFDHEYEEWNFSPKPATRLRVTFDPYAGYAYDIHELFIYESSGKTYPEPSLDEIRRVAAKEGVSTLMCDRKVASLFFGDKPPFRVPYLPFVESAPELTVAQWKAEPGFAALVDRADASELEERLKGQGFSSTPIGNKTLIAFKKDAGLMWWTGFTLIGAP